MAVLWILGISILLQFSAAGLALHLIGITGWRRAWLAIAAAVCLMAIRRSITLARLLLSNVSYPPDPAAELVALVISVLMVLGIASIQPIFRSLGRTEKALRKSEQRFRSIIEQSANGIAVTDEQGLITVWNRSLERITGLSARETVGKPIWTVQFQITPEKQRLRGWDQRFTSEIQGFLRTGEAPWAKRLLEWECARPDGTRGGTVAQGWLALYRAGGAGQPARWRRQLCGLHGRYVRHLRA